MYTVFKGRAQSLVRIPHGNPMVEGSRMTIKLEGFCLRIIHDEWHQTRKGIGDSIACATVKSRASPGFPELRHWPFEQSQKDNQNQILPCHSEASNAKWLHTSALVHHMNQAEREDKEGRQSPDSISFGNWTMFLYIDIWVLIGSRSPRRKKRKRGIRPRLRAFLNLKTQARVPTLSECSKK